MERLEWGDVAGPGWEGQIVIKVDNFPALRIDWLWFHIKLCWQQLEACTDNGTAGCFLVSNLSLLSDWRRRGENFSLSWANVGIKAGRGTPGPASLHSLSDDPGKPGSAQPPRLPIGRLASSLVIGRAGGSSSYQTSEPQIGLEWDMRYWIWDIRKIVQQYNYIRT